MTLEPRCTRQAEAPAAPRYQAMLIGESGAGSAAKSIETSDPGLERCRLGLHEAGDQVTRLIDEAYDVVVGDVRIPLSGFRPPVA